jgi:hypothetical protein
MRALVGDCSVGPWARKGLEGCASSHAEGGAGAIAESRKARFFASGVARNPGGKKCAHHF